MYYESSYRRLAWASSRKNFYRNPLHWQRALQVLAGWSPFYFHRSEVWVIFCVDSAVALIIFLFRQTLTVPCCSLKFISLCYSLFPLNLGLWPHTFLFNLIWSLLCFAYPLIFYSKFLSTYLSPSKLHLTSLSIRLLFFCSPFITLPGSLLMQYSVPFSLCHPLWPRLPHYHWEHSSVLN